MGVNSSKTCLIKFNDNPHKDEFVVFSRITPARFLVDTRRWTIDSYGTDPLKIDLYTPHLRKFEFFYQIILTRVCAQRIVKRGIGSFGKTDHYCVEMTENGIFSKIWKSKCVNYSHVNFQVKVFAMIDEKGLRKWNFEDKDVYGESKLVIANQNYLEVPVKSITQRAPLLAADLENSLSSFSKVKHFYTFLQVLHGTHMELHNFSIVTLLQLSSKFDVMTVKRYCEQQLIWRSDLEFFLFRKYELAIQFNLNHLLKHLFNRAEKVEDFILFVSDQFRKNLISGNIMKMIVKKILELS
ncbi:unnamed protein product [Caenorhabditis brenneri]